MSVDLGENGLDIFCSLCVLLTIAWMSKVYRLRTDWIDTIQVGKWNPHLLMGLKPFGGPKGLSGE